MECKVVGMYANKDFACVHALMCREVEGGGERREGGERRKGGR